MVALTSSAFQASDAEPPRRVDDSERTGILFLFMSIAGMQGMGFPPALFLSLPKKENPPAAKRKKRGVGFADP